MDPITERECYLALTNGYTIDLGQMSPAERRKLDKAVKEGKMIKRKAYFPYLTAGFGRPRNIWISTTK